MEDGESRDSGCGYWTSDDFLGSRNQNQGHMEVRQMLADADVGASTCASLTSGAASAAPQTDQSREQSQHFLIMQAARAMMISNNCSESARHITADCRLQRTTPLLNPAVPYRYSND